MGGGGGRKWQPLQSFGEDLQIKLYLNRNLNHDLVNIVAYNVDT